MEKNGWRALKTSTRSKAANTYAQAAVPGRSPADKTAEERTAVKSAAGARIQLIEPALKADDSRRAEPTVPI